MSDMDSGVIREPADVVNPSDGEYTISVQYRDGSRHVEQYHDLEEARAAWTD